jgi:hypothetical protein
MIESEREKAGADEENIKNTFKMRNDKLHKETLVDENIKSIQYLFEEWFNVVGQFVKKPAKKPKA